MTYIVILMSFQIFSSINYMVKLTIAFEQPAPIEDITHPFCVT